MTDTDRFTTPLKSVKNSNKVTNWLDISKNIVIGILLIVIGWFVVPLMYDKAKPTIGTIATPATDPDPVLTINPVENTPDGGVIVNNDTTLESLSTDTEVFIRVEGEEDPAPAQELVTAHAELRQIKAELEEAKKEVAFNRSALNAITKAINNGRVPTGTVESGVTEAKVRSLIAYYWGNHDDVADKRGYRNVIRWKDVNY